MRARIVATRALPAMVVVAALVLASVAAAHSELVSSKPAAGETVVGNPEEISGQYSETLDPDGSSLVLVDPNGTNVARGGVAAGATDSKEMSIDPVPQLAPGVYTVKSTTKSAEDGDIDRKTWQFRVVAPSPSPTVEPSPTAEPSSTPEPTASPTATVAPSASPAPGSSTGSGGDVILPIVAALAIVAIGGSLLLTRGRRAGPPR
jgi:methionine-rich copper-binding protein CopC